MAVFRVERNKGYTVMSNHHLRNKELTLKAKGLLSQMLSLPEDWDYTLAGLSHINRESIDAIRTAVGDLYNELLKQPEPEAARIAAALELYVSGSLNVFNHRTNVELSNRLVCFDIKQLGKQLKKLGMLIVQDQVWNRVTINRAEKKSTRYYMDEFHLLLKEEQTAAYSVEIWKRFRKWGGIPTAITQNVKDLLASREVENIFENSDFVLMLNQAQGDRLKEDWEALREYREMKQELADSAPEKEALLLYGKEDAFGIYQLKDGAATRDLHFEPYDRLQASGNAVDPANYELIYTAPLAAETSLEDIYIRFNTDHPKDFKGHSLSVSDVVVLHQDGENAAHYVDSLGFRDVPEFLQPPTQQKELAPDDLTTGETVKTPRGSFHLTAMSREQMEAAGYGLHHQSDDGKYLIMGNGTRAYAISAEQPENHLKHIEDTVEQNDNSFDGIINNTPTPTIDELEAKAAAGEQISLAALAGAIRRDFPTGQPSDKHHAGKQV